MKGYRLVLACFLIFLAFSSKAQIQIDTSRNVEFLVNEILIGKGILAGNITYQGPRHSIGLFKDEKKPAGISNGIILSSGNVFFSAGPNKSPRTGWASNSEGDEDLNSITRGTTYDAAVLEFDFITESEILVFNFVFASEEYQEYVGSKFNDVFGFFLTGPNADHENLATLPDGKTPITINNVNHETGSEFYVDNPYYNNIDPFVWDVRRQKVVRNKRYQKSVEPARYDTQFDGFTVVLQARYEVIPNEIYHIKLAIADVSDGILDSGVFLEAGSFESFGDQVVTLNRKAFTLPVSEATVSDVDDREIMRSNGNNLKITPQSPTVTAGLQDFRIEDLKPINVHFGFDSYAIEEGAYAIINNVVQILEHDSNLNVEVVGHTDSDGTDKYNIVLSQNRSDAVIKYLVRFGVNPYRISKSYMGENEPLAPNDTPDGRALNRRVEFIFKEMIN